MLASPQAVEMGIYVVRAFVRLRQAASVHADLAKRLEELEEKTERLALSHDTFSRNTRAQLMQVFDALRELMVPPDPPKRPIGFVPPEEKKPASRSKASSAKGVSILKVRCSQIFANSSCKLTSTRRWSLGEYLRMCLAASPARKAEHDLDSKSRDG